MINYNSITHGSTAAEERRDDKEITVNVIENLTRI